MSAGEVPGRGSAKPFVAIFSPPSSIPSSRLPSSILLLLQRIPLQGMRVISFKQRSRVVVIALADGGGQRG